MSQSQTKCVQRFVVGCFQNMMTLKNPNLKVRHPVKSNRLKIKKKINNKTLQHSNADIPKIFNNLKSTNLHKTVSLKSHCELKKQIR